MQPVSSPDTERKIIAILKVLSESCDSLGSITIARELERHGVFISERAVRYHLRITDERGFTEPLGRDGRRITMRGLEELKMALAPEQVNFVLEKLELLAFNTTFDPKIKSGLVPINTSLMDKDSYRAVLAAMKAPIEAGICVSKLCAIAAEGEKLGSIIIPPGKVGLATVCSAVVNGVLLKSGIPINSRFGGVLELRNSLPRRFIAIINYSGTSLDPSEQYIRAKMTSVGEAALTGNGKILANFREIPAVARALVEERIEALKNASIDCVSVLGNTSEAVCQIPVGLNRVGIVMLGGLNPVAAAVESGEVIESVAESGLVEYSQLLPFHSLLS